MPRDEQKKRIQPVDEVELLRHAASDWRLSRGDVGVFSVLLRHCDSKWRCFPGPSLIAQMANLHLSNAKASLRELEELRYIAIERPGLRKKNRFEVLTSPRIPSRKTVKIIRSTSRDLGLARPKDAPRSEQRRLKKLGAPSGPVPFQVSPETGCELTQTTGCDLAHQLGAPARHEVAFKSPNELPPLASPGEEQRQQRQQEEA